MVRLHHSRRLSLSIWAASTAFQSSVTDPEDWPESFRIDPVGSWPLFAGDGAPGVVGLYTVVNALDLILAPVKPLTPSEIDWLLDLGWRFLANRERVNLFSSTRLPTMVRLAEALSFSISRRRRGFITSTDILVSADARSSTLLERCVVAHHAVILLLGGGHYSVIRGYTPDSWLLFDCTGRRWVQRNGRRGGPWKQRMVGSKPTRIIILKRA